MAPRANGLNLTKRNVASPRSPHYYCARDTDKTPDFTRAKGKRQKAKKKKKKKKQATVAKNAWEMKRQNA